MNDDLPSDLVIWAEEVAQCWARRRCIPKHRLEDGQIEQAGRLGLWESLQKYDAKRGDFKTFARCIIINRVNDEVRTPCREGKAKRRIPPRLMRSLEADRYTWPSVKCTKLNDAIAAETESQIFNSITNAKSRECLRLSAVGYSSKDISKRLCMSRSSVVGHTRRARILASLCAEIGVKDDEVIESLCVTPTATA